MRHTGLHLRLNSSFLHVVQQAQALQLKTFQCFFISQETHEAVPISQEDKDLFLREYRSQFDSLYLHGSYWINLATVRPSQQRVFFRERDMADRLQFTHMVIHPGAATGGRNKGEGIDALARFLNTVCAQPSPVKLVLENGIHAGMSVGGDLHDFRLVLEKVDFPDRVFFCIDTAHAYSYGYDVAKKETQSAFIGQLEKDLGLSRIILIHLNDTKERLGSRIDRHAVIGQGNIGLDALRDFIADERVKECDVILELPAVPLEQERALFEMVKGWSEK